MKAALVRTKETKQLVGFFAYQNNDELLCFIDAICNPDDCDYKSIKSGGIIWDGPDDGVALTEFDEESDDNWSDLPGATFSEGLSSEAGKQANWNCCTKLYESGT